MFLDPFLLMLLMLILSLSGVILFFLPSIIEIKKPKDNGPRRILKKPLQETLRKSTLVLTSKPDSTYNPSALIVSHGILKKEEAKIHRIGKNTMRIFGDAAFPPKLEFLDNVVVQGALTVGDYCVFHGSVKAEGNVSIGNCVVVKGNLVSKRNVDIQEEAIIAGSVHAEGSVKLGEKVFVGLSVVAEGDVELFENSEVKKNILTHGVIRVLRQPKLDLPSFIQDIG